MRYIKQFDNAENLQQAINDGEIGKPYVAYVGEFGSGELDINTKDVFIDKDIFVSLRTLKEVLGDKVYYEKLGKDLYVNYNDGNPDQLYNYRFFKNALLASDELYGIENNGTHYVVYRNGLNPYKYANIDIVNMSNEDVYWWNSKRVDGQYVYGAMVVSNALKPTGKVYVNEWGDYDFVISNTNMLGEQTDFYQLNQVYVKTKLSKIKDYIIE